MAARFSEILCLLNPDFQNILQAKLPNDRINKTYGYYNAWCIKLTNSTCFTSIVSLNGYEQDEKRG
jgi:hypothetical protein